MSDDEFITIERTNEDICDKLDEVVSAIEENAESRKWFMWPIIGVLAWAVAAVIFSDVWHSKTRYAIQYQVRYSNIYIKDKPHDCAFLSAPVGNKWCHYDAVVVEQDVRFGKDPAGQSIVSYDAGKAWSPNADSSVSTSGHKVTVSWSKVYE